MATEQHKPPWQKNQNISEQNYLLPQCFGVRITKFSQPMKAAVMEKFYGVRGTKVLPTGDISKLDFLYMKLRKEHGFWNQINSFHLSQ